MGKWRGGAEWVPAGVAEGEGGWRGARGAVPSACHCRCSCPPCLGAAALHPPAHTPTAPSHHPPTHLHKLYCTQGCCCPAQQCTQLLTHKPHPVTTHPSHPHPHLHPWVLLPHPPLHPPAHPAAAPSRRRSPPPPSAAEFAINCKQGLQAVSRQLGHQQSAGSEGSRQPGHQSRQCGWQQRWQPQLDPGGTSVGPHGWQQQQQQAHPNHGTRRSCSSSSSSRSSGGGSRQT